MHSDTPPPRPDARPAAAPGRRNRYRPDLERFEPRTLLTTYTVTALTDAGAGRGTSGDLRYCIERADADHRQDTITFAVTGTIRLGSTLPQLVNGRGITIAGPGAGSLTLQGGGTSSDFAMMDIPGRGNVTLSGLTIADGSGQSGGAIFTRGRLSIEKVTFSGNSARVDGGAIYSAGTLRIADSTFVGNTAGQSGGGLYSLGAMTITGSTIDNNSAVSSGGGLEATNSAVAITDTTIADNSTEFYGGGISLNGPFDADLNNAPLTLINSTLSGNTAGRPTGGGFGGAISSFDSQMTIQGTSFTGNASGRAAGGVGINGGSVSIAGSTFTGNTTGGDGGGIFTNGGNSINGLNFTNGASLNVVDSTLDGNAATRDGGGVYSILTTVKFTGATVSANTAGRDGGGFAVAHYPILHLTHGTLTLDKSTVAGNTAGRDGGGIGNFDHVILAGATITGNRAGNAGGGVYNGENLRLASPTIAGNTPDDVARDG